LELLAFLAVISDAVDEVVVAGLGEQHRRVSAIAVVRSERAALVAVAEVRPRHFQHAVRLRHVLELCAIHGRKKQKF
jgi:hypothetical protein